MTERVHRPAPASTSRMHSYLRKLSMLRTAMGEQRDGEIRRLQAWFSQNDMDPPTSIAEADQAIVRLKRMQN